MKFKYIYIYLKVWSRDEHLKEYEIVLHSKENKIVHRHFPHPLNRIIIMNRD